MSSQSKAFMNKKGLSFKWIIIMLMIVIVSSFIVIAYLTERDVGRLDKCIVDNRVNEGYDYNSIISCCIEETIYRASYCLSKFKPGVVENG